jgi:uncharacterized protein GlcG (DUF336 family)
MFAHNYVCASGERVRGAAAFTVAALIGFCPAASTAEEALVTYKSISPDLAIEIAQASLKKCRDDGLQVAIVVMDRFGQPLVLLRDRFAGLPAASTASAKALTSLSFRLSTADFVTAIQGKQLSPELGRMPNIVMLAGGVPIESGGSLVGAIGVSGAPGGDKDEACARAGLDAVRDKLDF